MDQNVKLILAFLIGLIVGVLGATSTLFQGEPEPSEMRVITSNPSSETVPDSGAESMLSHQEPVESQAQVEQPMLQTEPEADGLDGNSENALSQNESEESGIEEDEPGESDVSERVATETQEAGDPFFCMLIESSGQCRCFDTETNAPVDISVEECRDQLAAE